MDATPGHGLTLEFDEQMMQLAMAQAELARAQDEVPVGAVITDGSKVIACGFNQPISAQDPSAHAEMQAIRAAAKTLGNYRLNGLSLYVTLEPCAMCAGAIMHSRLAHVVYGAPDLKTGVHVSTTPLFDDSRLNHHADVRGGVLASECGEQLSSFFAQRRAQKKAAH